MTLAHDFGKPEGKVEIGIRPEFVTLSDGEGLPVTLSRVEDVGRHKIVRADLFGSEINLLVPEGQSISPDMNRITFGLEHVNVYVDDWRIEGKAAEWKRPSITKHGSLFCLCSCSWRFRP